MSTRTINLDDRLYSYLLGVGVRETPLQARLREETSRLPMARMQISPEQGQFMALLVQLLGAKRCLEVGTFTGYSALSVAQVLPPAGEIIAMDVSPEWTAIARRYWAEAGVDDRILLKLGPAADTLRELAGVSAGSFDFMFVDADKEGYGEYYELGLSLLRPGGVIAFDNVLWGGRVADPEVTDADTRALRALNSRLHTDSRVDIALVPIGDGLTLARKR